MADHILRPSREAPFISWSTGFLLIGLIVFTMALSAFFFLSQSLRLDESQSLWQSAHSLSGILYFVANDVHVPLYHFMLYFWQLAFGNDIARVRVLSLIFYILGIPALYVLGRIAFNEYTGRFAAILFTFSAFMQWYGNEARMYTLLALISILNQIFFILIYKIGRERPRFVWIGYGLTAFIGMFTHYFFLLILATQAMFYFLFRGIFPPHSLRRFATTAGLLLIAFLPWLIYVWSLGSASNTQPNIAPPSTVNVFNTFSNFLFGFQLDSLNTAILSSWPLVLLFGFLALQRNRRATPELIYFVMTTVLSILAIFMVSYAFRPFYLSRYFTGVFPSFCLIIAWFFSAYPQSIARIFSVVLCFVMLLMLGIEIVRADTPVKEDYRAASDYISLHATARDAVLISAPFTIYPFEYYYHGEASVATVPAWNRLVVGPIPPFSQTELANEAATFKDHYQYIWVLLSYDQGYEGTVRLYFDTHFERVLTQNFSPGLNLYVYRSRYGMTNLAVSLARIKNTVGVASTTPTATIAQ